MAERGEWYRRRRMRLIDEMLGDTGRVYERMCARVSKTRYPDTVGTGVLTAQYGVVCQLAGAAHGILYCLQRSPSEPAWGTGIRFTELRMKELSEYLQRLELLRKSK